MINIKNLLKTITPEKAWNEYVDAEPELFISNFYLDKVTDLKRMCEIYASELPYLFNFESIIFTVKDIEKIEKLLYKYLTDYIKKKGGLDKLKLYTEQEIDEIDKNLTDDVLEYLGYRFNTNKKGVKDLLKK